ncbi:MAG: hypothetical protein EOO28_22705 [Comamonadaceae bacterium]|nr:MAG: hypothetical protein EOO28_22705 [Comamonadaceae bacterium]
MKIRLLPAEATLLAGFIGLLALAVFAPPLAQSSSHHAFADGPAFAGIPHAMDVLSNLPFVAWGLAGLACLRRGLVSGHSLKHVAAAFAAWPVLSAVSDIRVAAVKRRPRTGHNRTQSGGGAGRAMKPVTHV